MKLRPDQLSKHIQTGLAPIYIISGDVPLLIQESADRIKTSAKKIGFTEFKRFFVDGQFDWHELYHHTQSLSLFGDKNLIELRMPTGKPNDKGRAFLKEFAQNPDRDNLILIITEKLDSAIQRSAWFKAAEKAGVFIQVWPVEANRLPQWIHLRMKKAGLVASDAAARIIAEKVEGNLLAAAQEIEKLRLLHGEGPIDENVVMAAITDSARYDVFQLMEVAFLGNTAKALKILRGIKQEGNDPTLVLWAVTRELRNLAEMASKLERGTNLARVFQENRVWEKRKPPLQNALKRLPKKQILSLIQKAQQADLAIKGLEKDDPWLILNEITLLISQPRPSSTSDMAL